MGWLTDRIVDSKVSMCVKEVKWHFEAASPAERGKILAMSHVLRSQIVMPDLDPSGRTFDRPSFASRPLLCELYGILEDLRNAAKQQADHLRKSSELVGVNVQFALELSALSNRALEVWMCTLGGAIVGKRQSDVREIWTVLISAKGLIRQAIAEIYRIERMSQQMTGGVERSAFPSLDEWIRLCDWTPQDYQG